MNKHLFHIWWHCTYYTVYLLHCCICCYFSDCISYFPIEEIVLLGVHSAKEASQISRTGCTAFKSIGSIFVLEPWFLLAGDESRTMNQTKLCYFLSALLVNSLISLALLLCLESKEILMTQEVTGVSRPGLSWQLQNQGVNLLCIF